MPVVISDHFRPVQPRSPELVTVCEVTPTFNGFFKFNFKLRWIGWGLGPEMHDRAVHDVGL